MSAISEAPAIDFTADEHPKSRNLALDGLRAFSVLAVLAFHGGVARLHGGYLGVDVFFALSGFLITSLLVTEFDRRDTIGLARFWVRRGKRLLPALLLMILVVCLGALLLTPPNLYPSLHMDVFSSMFYFANWHLMSANSSYFTITLPPTLLTHTWSLAIEEQFYIFWPLVVMGILRFRKNLNLLAIIATGGAVTSAALMAYGYANGWSTNRLYYGTDTHAEGLLCGAAVACLIYARRSNKTEQEFIQHRLWKVAGPIAMIAALVILDRAYGDSGWMFQGGFFAMAVAASVSIGYLATSQSTMAARFFAVRPLVYIGQISYGLYLWHYPIFHWITGYGTSLRGWPLLIVRVVVSFAAAVLSYHFVEMPIRRGAWPKSARGNTIGVVIIALVLVVSELIVTNANEIPQPAVPAASTTLKPVSALFLGDSMSVALAFQLANWGPHYGIKVGDEALLGCGIVPSKLVRWHGTVDTRNNPCNQHRNGWFLAPRIWRKQIAKYQPDVVVVLAGRWETHDLNVNGKWLSIFDPVIQNLMATSIDDLAADAATNHAKLVFMTSPCAWDGEKVNGNQWAENLPSRNDKYNSLLRANASRVHATVFDLKPMVCNNQRIEYMINGHLVRTADGIHFGPDAAPYLAPRIFPYLRRIALGN